MRELLDGLRSAAVAAHSEWGRDQQADRLESFAPMVAVVRSAVGEGSGEVREDIAEE